MSIARNSALMFASRALGLASGLVSSVFTARYLGPSGRGILTVANTALAMLLLFGNLGLNHTITYFIGKGHVNERQAFGFALLASLVSSAVFYGIALAVLPLLRGNVLAGVDDRVYLVALLALPAGQFASMWVTLEMAVGRFDSAARYQVTVALLSLAAVVGVLLLVGSVYSVVIANTVLVTSAGVFLLVRQVRQRGVTFRMPQGFVGHALRYGMRVYAGSVFSYLYLRLDAFILNAFSGAAAVGQYSTAVTVNERIWVLDSAVNQATLPEVVARDRERARELVARTCRVVLSMSALAALALWLLAPPVVGLLYGTAFAPAVTPLRWLLPGTVLASGSRALSQHFSGQMGQPGRTSAVAGAGTVVSVALYLTLIPRFAESGAAISSTIAYAFMFAVLLVMFVRESAIPVRRVVLPVAEDRAIYSSVLGVLGLRRR